MYAKSKLTPRGEYREQQKQRVSIAPCLSEKYAKLKSLSVTLGYYAPDSRVKYRELSYDVNLNHAKSVFRIDCMNDECVQGDFELSKELATAITKRTKVVEGEMCCQGWLNKASIKKTKCSHVIRYKLKLGY